ncbi:MAG TPA: hypothetical protein VMH37_08520, partial [Candidatus Binataceae bacterium]|nr:hypothetical protein [Candidatus Binataceae bacterium]
LKQAFEIDAVAAMAGDRTELHLCAMSHLHSRGISAAIPTPSSGARARRDGYFSNWNKLL